MRNLTEEERNIYNEGERLIPGLTHDISEVIRHRSSYVFWKRIIELDISLKHNKTQKKVGILDLGCGVGHGCKVLSSIPNTLVTGVDVSEQVIGYARKHYPARNIEYLVADIDMLIESENEYDYIVSRGVIEHIEFGIHKVFKIKSSRRLMFDVPYAEPLGANKYHVLNNINEDSFLGFPNVELYYQSMDGVSYNSLPLEKPNMIMCISSHQDLPLISNHLSFPFSAWSPKRKNSFLDRINGLFRKV